MLLLFSFVKILAIYCLLMRRLQGVSIGGGIGSMSDIVDAAQLICEKVDISCSIAKVQKIQCFGFH